MQQGPPPSDTCYKPQVLCSDDFQCYIVSRPTCKRPKEDPRWTLMKNLVMVVTGAFGILVTMLYALKTYFDIGYVGRKDKHD